MQGSSHRALGQRQREDSGPKSSSFETSYFVSTRDTLPVTLLVSQENRSVSRLICNRNCMSRNHLPKQRPDNCFQCKGCFCFFVFFFKEKEKKKEQQLCVVTRMLGFPSVGQVTGVCGVAASPINRSVPRLVQIKRSIVHMLKGLNYSSGASSPGSTDL